MTNVTSGGEVEVSKDLAGRGNGAAQGSRQEYTIGRINEVKASRTLWSVVIILALALTTTVFVLPQYVQLQSQSPSDDKAESVTLSPGGTATSVEGDVKAAMTAAVSPLAEAAKLKFRRETQDVLANILELQTKLEQQNSLQWAAQAMAEIDTQLSVAELSYQRAEYESSLAQYVVLETVMTKLIDDYAPLLAQYITEGDRAFNEGDAQAAELAYSQALVMAPTNGAAVKGLARAKTLPQLLTMMSQAQDFFESGELQRTIEEAERILSIDAQYMPAQSQLQLAVTALAERRFQTHMSKGFLMLEKQQWSLAADAFKQADQSIADRPEPAAALAQLQAKRQQVLLVEALQKARQLEQREQWQQALVIYDQLLKDEPGLVDPAARRVQVKVRASIDAQLQGYLDDPLELADDNTFNAASRLLDGSRPLAQSGSRLHRQLQQLEEVLSRMSKTFPVEFISDGFTEVSLFRVSPLGKFMRKSYELRPGNYVVAGGRKGYRDVRVAFTLTGMSSPLQIRVECTESI